MSGTTAKLNYLFVAEFADGSYIEQTQADTSNTMEGKSAFYDVQQKKGLTRFSLVEVDGSSVFTVDLRDGLFEINGVAFQAHNNSKDQYFIPTKPLQLIYWREVQVYSRLHDGQDEDRKHFVSRNFLGWQTKSADGIKNETRIISTL